MIFPFLGFFGEKIRKSAKGIDFRISFFSEINETIFLSTVADYRIYKLTKASISNF